MSKPLSFSALCYRHGTRCAIAEGTLTFLSAVRRSGTSSGGRVFRSAARWTPPRVRRTAQPGPGARWPSRAAWPASLRCCVSVSTRSCRSITDIATDSDGTGNYLSWMQQAHAAVLLQRMLQSCRSPATAANRWEAFGQSGDTAAVGSILQMQNCRIPFCLQRSVSAVRARSLHSPQRS